MKEREIFGHWSLGQRGPTDGRLLIDEAGVMDLQLRGFLEEGPRALGQLSDGKPATLFDLGLLSRNPDRHFFEEYRVGTAVLGLALGDVHDPCLASAVCRLDGLKEAVGVSGLSLEVSGSQQERFAKVEWQGSKAIEATLPVGRLKISNLAHFQRESDFQYVLEHVVEAKLQAANPLGLEEVEEVFDTLAALLAFAIEARVSIGSLWVTQAVDNGEKPGEVLTKRRPSYGEPPAANEPWLVLGSLEDPASAVEGFYRFAQDQAAAYLILFEFQVFFAALNPIDKLLYLARFLEVYHRTRFPGFRDPEDVQQRRESLVKEALGEEHKEWGSHVLHHSNEITFKERIVSLLEGPARVASPIIGAPAADFARVVGNCRNYWTHYAPELERKALFDVELDQLDDRLLLVVRALVLAEMGVSASDAQAALENDWRWRPYLKLPLRIPGRKK
ncbi:MAG TPA: HEPN domain-containing protein [Solirubrobacterales bacterium]